MKLRSCPVVSTMNTSTNNTVMMQALASHCYKSKGNLPFDITWSETNGIYVTNTGSPAIDLELVALGSNLI